MGWLRVMRGKSSLVAFWGGLCLLCLPLAALAGETIIWNGAGQPGTTGVLRPDEAGFDALFPDSPSGNRVVVNGDVPEGHVFGGVDGAPDSSNAAETANNSVSVNGGTVDLDVQGGCAQSYGDAASTGNSVNVSGGGIGLGVLGGSAWSAVGNAAVTGNSVSISNGVIGYNVDGGYAWSDSGNATATGNSTSVSGGSIGLSVDGGYARTDTGNALASGNSVRVSGGSIGNGVDGGYAWSDAGTALATGNSVNISGGYIGHDVDGGYAWTENGTAAATGNSVRVSGGFITFGVYGGSAWSETGHTSATGNSVNVSGGTVGYGAYGGSVGSFSGSATATGNSLNVSGGTIGGDAFGGFAWSESNAAVATGNSVNISGGTVTGSVLGGFALSGYGAAAASGNSVSVTGGRISGDVYGGFMYSAAAGTAVRNTVTLSGSPAFAAESGLYGGFDPFGEPGMDVFTGNTLNVWNYTGGPVHSAGNFQHYNFLLPAAMRRGDTLLEVTGTAWFDDSQSGAGSGVRSVVTGVNIMGGGTPLQAGESVTLMRYGENVNTALNSIDGNGGNGGSGGNGGNGSTGENGIIQGGKGVSLLYTWQLRQDGERLTATVMNAPKVNPRIKALAEGRLAGLGFVNQGADLAAGTGMSAARNAGRNAARNAAGSTDRNAAGNTDRNAAGNTDRDAAGNAAGHYGGAAGHYGLAPFFAAQGGTSCYATGSHVDVDGVSLMAGLAWNTRTEHGSLLLGAFFEAGWGNYDSHNSFSQYASVHGSGDTEYSGGGVMGRFDGNAAGPGAFYAEASFRAGRSETDFSSGDLRDGLGQKAGYTSESAYYGAHVGLGYIRNLTQTASLDVFTRYFWTHQEGDSVRVTGDPIRFHSADSHRWRGGVRFSRTLNAENGLAFTPYIGAAYEHEFDGTAKATAYGQSIRKPDLTGGSGMGELGFSFTPPAKGAAGGLSFDLGVQGYTGMREGLTGSFQVKWEF